MYAVVNCFSGLSVGFQAWSDIKRLDTRFRKIPDLKAIFHFGTVSKKNNVRRE